MFSFFSSFKNFLTFCQKNLLIKAEKTFSGNNVIWYAFYSKFPTLSDFEKIQFFRKASIC